MFRNPFRTALLATSLIAAGIALVLAIVTASIGSPYDEQAYIDAQRGPVIAWASALAGLAVTTILLWLHASSISWAAENPSPAKSVEEKN